MNHEHSGANAPCESIPPPRDLLAEIRDIRQAQPYVEVSKALLADSALSFKAKGVLCYLLSRPQGVQVRLSDIVGHATDGEYAVRGAIKELVAQGLVCHERDGFGWVTALDSAALRARYGAAL